MIDLTEAQCVAIKRIVDWYGTGSEFVLHGYAGTGKTSLLPHAIQALGLSMNEVLFLAYTGKACRVLHGKGIPAVTIHSALYSPVEDEDDGKVRFIYQPKPDALLAKLVVVDEASMVDGELAEDIRRLGKPLLLVLDPAQLPPVGPGKGAFNVETPNVLLQEIHRQAEGSSIIRLATKIRNGGRPNASDCNGSVRITSSKDLPLDDLLSAGMVLCGLNKTRMAMNAFIRKQKGFNTELPAGPDEKVICRRNDSELGVLNGCFVRLSEISQIDPDVPIIDEGRFHALVETDIGTGASQMGVMVEGFKSLTTPKRVPRGVLCAAFGEVITVHNAQGSEDDNVIVFLDWGIQETMQQWLYTAVTRARKSLTLVTRR